MKTIFILGVLLSSLLGLGQEVKHYNLDVKINVKDKLLKVSGYLDIDFQNQDSISLILWRNTKIENISYNGKQVTYVFDTISKSPNTYIKNGSRLVLKSPYHKEQLQKIYFSYLCNMAHMDVWGNQFTDDWIELGIYSAWYPVNIASQNFNSELKVSIDENYKVNGSGLVTKSNDIYNISHSWDIFDNIIIASKALKNKTFKKKNTNIDILYSEFPESDIDTLSYRIKDILNFYTELFGKNAANSYMKFVLVPGNEGGYSRPKYISYTSNVFDSYLLRGIAHEIAHFWWNKANTNSWEDWLNESFANFSYLIYIRDKVGEEEYHKIIEDFKNKTKDAPPVWGIQRNSKEAYNVLYRKGALILVDFENKITKKHFYRFIKNVATNRINTTNKFLDLIEQNFSTSERLWFEKKLKE